MNLPKKILILTFFLCSILTVCLGQEGKTHITGLVLDKDTKQPIQFATAILYKLFNDGLLAVVDTYETDQSARYHFDLIPGKEYKILGNAPEYFANEIHVDGVREGNKLEGNISIEINSQILIDYIEYGYVNSQVFNYPIPLDTFKNQNPIRESSIGQHEHTFLRVENYSNSKYPLKVSSGQIEMIKSATDIGSVLLPSAIEYEGLINHFNYRYSQPMGEDKFNIETLLMPCPWEPKHLLLHIGIQGKIAEINKPGHIKYNEVFIAEGVSINLEFNSVWLEGYRLLGYEKQIFGWKADNLDSTWVDPVDIKSCFANTTLYELIPKGIESPYFYYLNSPQESPTGTGEILELKLQYTIPGKEYCKIITHTQNNLLTPNPSPALTFAATVAEFGLLLKDSKYKGNAHWERVLRNAEAGLDYDPDGKRKEFVELVKRVMELLGEE